MLGGNSGGQPISKVLFTDFIGRSQSRSCEVCGQTHSNEGNVLVTCKNCNLVVHQKCYAIQGSEGTDDYLCCECKNDREAIELWGENYDSDPAVLDCYLCPVPKSCFRAFKPIRNKLRKLGNAHVLCASYLPDARINHDLIDVTAVKESWQGWTATCILCKLKGLGSCSKCAYPDCGAWTHATCAASPLASENGFELNLEKRTILCPGHSQFASKSPELAQEFLRMISSADEADYAADMALAKSKKKKKGGLESSTPTPPPMALGKASKRGAVTPDLSAKPQKPAKTVTQKPDSTWINRRVCVFQEGFWGTALKVKRNKFVVALDDGKVQVERRPDELRLLPEREPGCMVCKSEDDEENMLTCVGCEGEAHMRCLTPPITNPPAERWVCDTCKTTLSGEGEMITTVTESAKKGKKPNGKAAPAKKRSRKEGEEAGDEAAEEGGNGEVEAGEEEEEENENEEDEKRRRKTATPVPSKSAAKSGSAKKALGGADDTFEVREENVEFDRLFPEFTAAMWAGLFKEMEHVHRAEMVTMMSRFGPSMITEQLRKSQGFAKRLVSVVSSKIIHQELPAACIEGFINYRMACGDALSQEEMNVLKQIWTVNDIKLDLNSVRVGSPSVKVYEIWMNPFQLESAFKLSKPLLHSTAPLGTTTATTTTTAAITDGASATNNTSNGSAMDVVEENGPSEVLVGVAQSAADQCADSLVPLDVQAILKACLDAHSSSPLPDIQLFVKMFAETVDRLRLDCERIFSRARLPAFRARELFRKLESRLRMIRMTEPVAKGEWRKTPYPRRAYETINDYEPVAIPQDKLNEERNRVLKKLETSKTPQCDESEKCSQLAPYSLKANGFITDRPCLSRRVGCKASTIGKDQPLVLKRDVIESDAWGFDSATRKFIDTSLDYVAAIKTSQVQNAIVEGFLIKCIHAQKQEHAADMSKALDYGLQALEICLGLFSSAMKVLDDEEARLLVKNSLNFIRGVTILDPSHLVTPLDLLRGFQGLKMVSKMFELQIRPKGVGIRCQMKSGFRAGTFISRYLGELYAPWRWFERQDGVKLAQNKVGFKPALPDFYNIMLERHEDDPDGYDVLFVDPIVRGNFASRLCHSCDPNCATVVMAVNGKFVIAVYALRDVDYGEELTFDYSSVTEDETEFRAAICLCGSANCRGSFLFYAGTGAFASVIGTHHTFLDRVAILLLSSMDYEMLDEGEEERLRKYGVGKSITGGLPLWMRKWASFILRFVDFERSQLAKDLLAKGTFTEDTARLEAQGVAENRRQNVAITLDKLGYFLRNSESTDHPLRLLSEEEVVDYLWNGPASVARRAIEAAVDSRQIPEPFEDRLNEFMDANPRAETHEDAKRLLLELKDVFWDCPINGSISFCESCGDILLMHALTDTWFTSSSYKGFKSPSVAIRNVDIGRDSVGTTTNTATNTSTATASGPNTFACSRNDLLAVHIGRNEDGGEFVVEKEDQADGAAASLPKYYVFKAQSLDGLVPIYVYRKLEGAGEDVVSLTPIQDIQRYLMRFAFFVFPSQAKDLLEPVKLQGYEGTEVPVFVLPEKNLKKCKFVEPAPAGASGEEETKLSSTALKVIFNEPKKYQSGFAWGQLVGWFKQTVSDPSASLSAERRGSLSLPDIESCFQKEPDVAKFNKSRKDMMKKIKEKPDGMWPVGWPYSFKNKEKIYGSPWFDDALDTARTGDFNRKNERCAVFLTIMSDHLSATGQQ